LMARAHEAMADSHGQGRLVTDRVEGFLADRRRKVGLLGRLLGRRLR
jgi:phospholipase C